MKNIRPNICRQCGSHDLKIENGKYVCNYCGIIQYEEVDEPGLYHSASKKITPNAVKVISAIATILLLAGIFVIILFSRREGPVTHPQAGTDLGKPKGLEQSKEGSIEEKKVAAEFINVSALPDSIGNIYFVGFYKNTGETLVLPKAEIALYDSKGEKIAVAFGYGIRGYILPGEETPISVLVSKAPQYQEFKSIGSPEMPVYISKRPNMKISNLKLAFPKLRFDHHTLSGKIQNLDKEASYVQIAAALIDGNGKIIGYSSNFLGQTRISSGETAPFKISFYLVNGKPESFKVEYNGMFHK
ncbi:MAG: TFIIB-type zinc finger domain-containing protein [Spirochaetes bacterium]|nr:TFIIB-type zinc finger domain-containing protein [Spirochaetota bacterium]